MTELSGKHASVCWLKYLNIIIRLNMCFILTEFLLYSLPQVIHWNLFKPPLAVEQYFQLITFCQSGPSAMAWNVESGTCHWCCGSASRRSWCSQRTHRPMGSSQHRCCMLPVTFRWIASRRRLFERRSGPFDQKWSAQLSLQVYQEPKLLR